ncbi:MAG TPA: copper chaperone PCu(A)C [Gemmatimonadales bacterium]|nr:copper chaperone PCu(A)C [Gemmatimonadales bacterium]
MLTRRSDLLLATLCLGVVVAGCSGERGDDPNPMGEPRARGLVLEATRAFLFAPITEAQAGGYFVLHNRGEASDTILEVSADWADHGMIHETREEGGRVRMSHLPVLPVPAQDSVVLRPGGFHVMLVRLARMPVAGDTVEWSLRMSSGATVRVLAPVVAYGQEP